MNMVIIGDLIELIDSESTSNEEFFENIPWEFHDGVKIPPETFALYSIESGIVRIQELRNEVFNGIEHSSFSHVYAHISPYDEMFMLIFEFAVEKNTEQFEFTHFGIVPTSDFFNILNDNPIIKIRHKKFQFTESSIQKILEKLTEFKSKYPDNSLL